MPEKLFRLINEVKIFKYFSVSIDFIPDIPQADKIVFVVRYKK